MGNLIFFISLHLSAQTDKIPSLTPCKEMASSKEIVISHFFNKKVIRKKENFNFQTVSLSKSHSEKFFSQMFVQSRPYIKKINEINVDNCAFLMCSSADSGGALFIEKISNDGVYLNISNSFFSDCYAQHMGGSIYHYDGFWNITNTCFSGSNADRGGSIFIISPRCMNCCLNCTSMIENGYGNVRTRYGTVIIEAKLAKTYNFNSSLNICSEHGAIGQVFCSEYSVIRFATFTHCNGNSGFYTKSDNNCSLHSLMNIVNVTKYRSWEGVICSISEALFSGLVIKNSSYPLIFSSINFECVIKDSFLENFTDPKEKYVILQGKWNTDNVSFTSAKTLQLTIPGKVRCSNFLSEEKNVEHETNTGDNELYYLLTYAMNIALWFGLALLLPWPCRKSKRNDDAKILVKKTKKPAIPLPMREV
jgi:hypothetical protein